MKECQKTFKCEEMWGLQAVLQKGVKLCRIQTYSCGLLFLLKVLVLCIDVTGISS
jgi:hypothetical protein